MYTAIQARNIANEKYNHDYYRLYRIYCRDIMGGITRAAKRGELHYDYCAGNRRMVRDVLHQIAQELGQLGYKAGVRQEQSEDGKHRYAVIDVSWGG